MKTIVELNVRNKDLSFEDAKSLAEAIASVLSEDAMNIAWYDRKKDRFFPQITCCDCGDGRPTWEIYADSRGARVKIVINHDEYVFLFL